MRCKIYLYSNRESELTSNTPTTETKQNKTKQSKSIQIYKYKWLKRHSKHPQANGCSFEKWTTSICSKYTWLFFQCTLHKHIELRFRWSEMQCFIFTFPLALDATLSYHFRITENVFIQSSHCKNSIAADFTQMCPLSLGIDLFFYLSFWHILSSIFVVRLT